MRKPAPEFLRLVALGKRLQRTGWTPLAIHTSDPSLRRKFQGGERHWNLALNPSVHASSALLNLWIVPTPELTSREWKNVNRTPFCRALDRKLQSLRFLKVFGCESGGSILFYKRLISVDRIARNWNRLAAIQMDTLDQQRIPDSPPVRRPIGPVRSPLREHILWTLVRQVQRQRMNTTHFSIGLTRKERALGYRWTINVAIYWHRHPGSVTPPSTFWAALLVWPPNEFSRRDRKALERLGFYSRVSRSLRKRKFTGRWLDVAGGFADFSRHQLRWKDIEPLVREFEKWTLRGALAEFPSKGRGERIHPVRRG